MKPVVLPSSRRARRRLAFSLIEIMLAVGLMGVIIFALYGMFHHTQKALRSNVTQVDVMEAGRAAMELVTRELAQMSPCSLAGGTNLLVGLSTNPPVTQLLVVSNTLRTNLLDDVYYLSRVDRDYMATAYRVICTNGVSVGTLSRYSTNVPVRSLGWSNTVVYAANRTNNLVGLVLGQPLTNYVPLASGVVHFRLRAYDEEGLPLEWQSAPRYTNWLRYTNVYLGTNLFLRRDYVTNETQYAFASNLLPAYVEVELGVLEPNTASQLQAIPANLAGDFLARHAGQVHLFRQRVPIRQSASVRTSYP
jgi:Tfp pilus assembly protein PilV